MISRKQLHRELGNGYEFKRLISDKELRLIQKEDPKHFQMQSVASLTAGCVKIEVTLYRHSGEMKLGYDVFVKDTPDAVEWICYDSPVEPVKIKEREMLAVLDKVVQKNGLSYTECCFDTLDGKQIKNRRKKDDTGSIAE